LGAGAKTMAYYRVDALGIEELGHIFTKFAGWSTGKAAGHSMMAWQRSNKATRPRGEDCY
jgi:hypothetical protein